MNREELQDYVRTAVRDSLITNEQFKFMYSQEDVRKVDQQHALNPTPENHEKLLLTLKNYIDTFISL